MNKKEEIIRLWRECFNDTEAFIRLFFDRIYQEENALTIEQGGKVIAALQMLPYEMTWQGERIKVAYIYGACTDKRWRNQGWMSRLLQQAFEVMAQRGIAMTVLIPAEPWLFDYYARQGYVTLFNYARIKVERASLPPASAQWLIEPVTQALLPAIYPPFDKLMESRACGMLHSYPDFVSLFADSRDNGGEWLVAYDTHGVAQGFLFLTPSDEGVTATELVATHEEVSRQLLQEAMRRYQVESITRYAPPTKANHHPLGMARLIAPAPLIAHWIKRHPKTSPSLHELEAMTPDALIGLLFCSDRTNPYMSLMMN